MSSWPGGGPLLLQVELTGTVLSGSAGGSALQEGSTAESEAQDGGSHRSQNPSDLGRARGHRRAQTKYAVLGRMCALPGSSAGSGCVPSVRHGGQNVRALWLLNEWKDEQADGQMCERMGGWVNSTNERLDGWLDGWVGGTDGWMGE